MNIGNTVALWLEYLFYVMFQWTHAIWTKSHAGHGGQDLWIGYQDIKSLPSLSPFLHFIMFTKQQGKSNKVLQGNKGRLMWCESLTRKLSKMWNTFNIQMKKNCFLAIKATSSLVSQPDSVVKSGCKSGFSFFFFFN